MKISLKNFSGNLNRLMRKLGYYPIKNQEQSFAKKIKGGEFPRFHIYIEENEIRLHLDQKPARYENETDHGGEYNTPIVKKEAKRIKSYVENEIS